MCIGGRRTGSLADRVNLPPTHDANTPRVGKEDSVDVLDSFQEGLPGILALAAFVAGSGMYT